MIHTATAIRSGAAFRPRLRILGRALLVLLGTLGALAPGATQSAPPKTPAKARSPKKPTATEKTRAFLEKRGPQLWQGKLPFNNVGANIPDLFERFLLGQDASAVKALTDAKAAGIRFVRCFGATWGPDHFDIFEKDPARWFGAYDRMLSAADQVNIAVVPSLLFNIRMIPDYVQRTRNRDEGLVGYLTGSTVSNNLAIAYVRAVVSRYKDDQRILFWEIGNEYNLEADLSAEVILSSDGTKRPDNQIVTSDQIRAFMIQIATLIKALDKNHLVTSGNGDMRPSSWHLRQTMLQHHSDPHPTDYKMDWTKDTYVQYQEILAFFNPPPLDIISAHLYPRDKANPDGDTYLWVTEDDIHALRLPWVNNACKRIGRPLFVGEFGEKIPQNIPNPTAPWLADFIQRLPYANAPLSAVWAWEFDQNMPDNTTFSLSPERTPDLVKLLATTNQAILINIVSYTPQKKK